MPRAVSHASTERDDGAAMNGVLLIDKPAGITSHDVVAAVRRALGGVKTGHAGTLDPFATGLLLVLVGRATRIQQQLMGLPKRYETLAQLGAVSSTGDPEGEITHTGRVPPDPPPLPTGEIRQRPPIHSAVKIGGERAYKRARRGEQFEMPERIVTVHRFEQLWREDRSRCLPDRVLLGHVRALADRRSAATPTAWSCGAPRSGRSRSRMPCRPPRRGEPWEPPEPLAIEQALALL